jgi:hypothetical protein
MESYPPEWSAKMEDIADTIRRAREVRLIAIECRHRAAVLRWKRKDCAQHSKA